MDRPTRRTFVAGAGIALATIGAGFVDSVETAGADPGSGGDETDDASDESDVSSDEPDGDSRVDEPPHEIDRPAVDDADDPREAWNDEYLGERMATEPSVAFESVEVVRLADFTIQGPNTDYADEAYAIRLVTTDDELTDAIDLDGTDADARSTLEAVDFDERVVIVVESGFGSGSIEQHWARVEPVDDGLHLHGYYTQPYERTEDLTARHSVIVADRPSEGGAVDIARASLTVDENRRVHVDSTEGAVTVEE